jgi:uncharacterized protein (TIGR04255 family)
MSAIEDVFYFLVLSLSDSLYIITPGQLKGAKYMGYESIKYKNTLIDRVIFRLDFSNYINSDEIFNNRISTEIKRLFTKKEMRQVMTFGTINISNSTQSGVSGQQFEGFQDTFKTDLGDRAILSNKFFILDIKQYNTFDTLLASIKPIIKSIGAIDNFKVERTGLRYINIVKSKNNKIRKKLFIPKIANYINPVIDVCFEELKEIRSLSISEYRYSDLYVTFRFGRYNSDYPNPIKSSDFVLDYDVFSDTPYTESEDIITFANKGHEIIQYLFESSITDCLRSEMNHD